MVGNHMIYDIIKMRMALAELRTYEVKEVNPMSSRSQDEVFRDFLAEINNLLYQDADTQSLSDRIHEAYESSEISTSQYDKLKRELDEYL